MRHSEYDPVAKRRRPWKADRKLGAKRALKPPWLIHPRRHDFFSAQSLQLSADCGVIMIHHLCPTRIAQPCSFFGRPNDINIEDRRERLFELDTADGGSTPDRNFSDQ